MDSLRQIERTNPRKKHHLLKCVLAGCLFCYIIMSIKFDSEILEGKEEGRKLLRTKDRNHFVNRAENNSYWHHPLLQFEYVYSMDYLIDMAFSERNRCTLYPRCILFGCCSKELLVGVEVHFRDIEDKVESHDSTGRFACMFAGNCNYSIPLSDRIGHHPMLGKTLTKAILAKMIAKLSPTHPKEYEALKARPEFKVLYMSMAKTWQHLTDGSSNQGSPRDGLAYIRDYGFLAFENITEGRKNDIFYPKSTFAEGRNALYVFARFLEVQQGWLYNYYVFLDDDTDWQGRSISIHDNYLQNCKQGVG
jgi:hypothetical protein